MALKRDIERDLEKTVKENELKNYENSRVSAANLYSGTVFSEVCQTSQDKSLYQRLEDKRLYYQEKIREVENHLIQLSRTNAEQVVKDAERILYSE